MLLVVSPKSLSTDEAAERLHASMIIMRAMDAGIINSSANVEGHYNRVLTESISLFMSDDEVRRIFSEADIMEIKLFRIKHTHIDKARECGAASLNDPIYQQRMDIALFLQKYQGFQVVLLQGD